MIHLATITVSSHKRVIIVPLIRVRFTMPTLGDVRPLNTSSKDTTTGVCFSRKSDLSPIFWTLLMYIPTMRAAAGTRLNRRRNSEYDQEIPQSQTAENPGHSEEEPHKNKKTQGRQTKQNNQPSFPHQDDCKASIGHQATHTKA